MRRHNDLRTDITEAANVRGLSLVGRRKENQDYCLADTRGRVCLAIVCDGLGGSVNGSLASSHAARMFHHDFFEVVSDSYIKENQHHRAAICQEIVKRIQDALSGSPDLEGSSTTLTALITNKEGTPFVDVVHIGDTRCYFETSGENYRCETDDHTVSGDLYRQGHIRHHEISKNHGNNAVTRFLGGSENTSVQFKTTGEMPRSAILCSDGVWGVLHDEAGLNIPPHADSNIAVELVQNAIVRGSTDNCTAIIVDLEAI